MLVSFHLYVLYYYYNVVSKVCWFWWLRMLLGHLRSQYVSFPAFGSMWHLCFSVIGCNFDDFLIRGIIFVGKFCDLVCVALILVVVWLVRSAMRCFENGNINFMRLFDNDIGGNCSFLWAFTNCSQYVWNCSQIYWNCSQRTEQSSFLNKRIFTRQFWARKLISIVNWKGFPEEWNSKNKQNYDQLLAIYLKINEMLQI